MKEQNARKYKEKKKKNQELEHKNDIERSKDQIEKAIPSYEKDVRDDLTLKLSSEEEKEIDRIISIGISKDMLEKIQSFKSCIQEKLILWDSKIVDTSEVVKKVIGTKEEWKYEERFINYDFIRAMFTIVKRYIADDKQLFRYHVHETLTDIACNIGQTVSYEVWQDIWTSYYKDRCIASLQQYDDLKDEIIKRCKTKSRTSFVDTGVWSLKPLSLKPLQQDGQAKVPTKSSPENEGNFIKKRKPITFSIEELDGDSDDDQEFNTYN